jgi:hypothetical protein
VNDIGALFHELDPLRPLSADDSAVYVDWQRELAPNSVDVKSRLARAFARKATPERPVVRLLTGHKGSGKTTELNRVSRQLRQGLDGRRIFTSTLFAQQWLDIDDVQPEDLVLQIVRQLVADLRAAGMSFGEQQFKSFFQTVWERMKTIRPERAEVGLDPMKFSFALQDFPTARSEFRQILRGQLPTVFDLVNRELLPHAREYLRDEHGFDDVLLIVDDLDKIPQKALVDQRITNHESLFLDNAATLRALQCSLLLTVPIELAYSPAQGRLKDDYGAAIVTVPLVSLTHPNGDPITAGENALVEVLGRRALRALHDGKGDPAAAAQEIFVDSDLLRRVVRLSGGHVRGLLVMLSELLDWIDELPIDAVTLDQYIPRAAADLARGLFDQDKKILRQVAKTHSSVEDTRFFDLLRNQYVFAYEARADEYWYGLNPLLREIGL